MSLTAKGMIFVIALFSTLQLSQVYAAEAPKLCSSVKNVIATEHGVIVDLNGETESIYIHGSAAASLLGLAKIYKREVCLIGIWKEGSWKKAANVSLL